MCMILFSFQDGLYLLPNFAALVGQISSDSVCYVMISSMMNCAMIGNFLFGMARALT